jgi:Ser/Thr protein kinase RdoA (MazF antagonist)
LSAINDPGLPGLTTILQPDAMLELLRRALRERGQHLELSGGKIVELWYRPGQRCTVLYELELNRSNNQRSRYQLLTAETLRQDQAPTPPPPELIARYQASGSGLLGTPSTYVASIRTVISAFPFDPKLPSLPDALDPHIMRHHFSRHHVERRAPIHGVDVHLLRYTPRTRATLLYEIHSESNGALPLPSRRLVGKVRVQDSPAPPLANTLALQRATGDRIHFAPEAGRIAPLGLTLQEYVFGEDLGSLAGSGAFTELARETARTLAVLHSLRLPLTRRDPHTDVQAVSRWADVLIAIRPLLGSRIARLRDNLIAALEAQAEVTAPIHGDFHPTNVIADRGRITLIDLDEVALGDRMVDVGRFLASLPVSALRLSREPSALAQAGAAFLDEYLYLAPGNESKVRLYEAAALLIAAAAPFRLQRPGWEEAATVLVEAAERAYASATPRASVETAEREPNMTIEERLSWSTDGPYMGAILAPYVHQIYGAALTDCAPRIAEQAAHRYRVRYALAGWQGDKPWSAELDGYYWEQRRRRELLPRLAVLARILENQPEAPLLPCAIGELPLPSMLVVGLPPGGVPFTQLVGTPEVLEVASAVGRALATLHQARVSVDRAPDLEQELKTVRPFLDRLAACQPNLHGRAVSFAAEVEHRLRHVPEMVGPILRTLSPDRVFWLGNRVAFTEIKDLSFAHPLLDAGDFLSRVSLLALEGDHPPTLDRAAERFREAYSAGTGASPEMLVAFEAAALLRLACSRAGRGRENVSDALLARVASLLAERQREA